MLTIKILFNLFPVKAFVSEKMSFKTPPSQIIVTAAPGKFESPNKCF